jgi:hypothetical protein
MNLAQITKRDLLYILILWSIIILIFYPLFTAEYVYTDEIVQLWQYKKGSSYQLFLPQGRLITEKLFQWLFSSATTIRDITYIRLFSLAGWMLSIPLWYVAIKRIVARENLPGILPFFSILFLVCSQQFCIYVSWAACLELFLANTAGLLSGYYLYLAISEWKLNRRKGIYLVVISVIAAQVSLFTYQSGFGCFLLPFLLHLIKEGKLNRSIITGVMVYLMMYGLYYLLFKLSLNLAQVGAVGRTDIVINPLGKLKFLLLKVMPSSFHFNYVMNENDKTGKIFYRILFGAWIILNFIQQKKNTIGQRIAYPFIIVLLWALIYLPSLLVKENYASNRTLLALNLSVFFLVMNSLIKTISSERLRKVVVIGICTLFIVNAWYNFQKLFLDPITQEYRLVRNYISENYKDETETVYLVRPEENFFKRAYGITRSWDELGVPSTFFNWVPDVFVKQIVWEKTGDRTKADSLEVVSWIRGEAASRNVMLWNTGTLWIDVEMIIMNKISVSTITPGKGTP